VSDIEDFYGMRNVLQDFNVKIILMDRSNLVKHAISLINALRLHQKTKHKYGKLGWNLYDEKERLAPQAIAYEEFDAALKRIILDRKILHAYAEYIGLPLLNLEYADLLKSKEEWVKRVFDFLRIQDQNLQSRILKNTNDDLTKALSNFDELKSHYVGTEFQKMFDETI
jgi:LPS sulfotransferase NodH